MPEKRFSGMGNEDYDFATIAFPNYNFIQENVCEAIRDNIWRHKDKRNIHILELGSGTGLTSEQILRADDRILLGMVDNEFDMIIQATKRLKRYNEEGRTSYIQKDALEFCKLSENYYYDFIVSGFMIHNKNKEYRSSLFSQIYRILETKGIFIEADTIAPDNEEQYKRNLQWQLKKLDLYAEHGRPDLRDYWREHIKRDNKPDLLFRESELILGLKMAGFSEIKRVCRRRQSAVFVAR